MSVFDGTQTTPGSLDDFIWKMNKEPHFSRRKQIVSSHPEVKSLYGIETKTKYYVLGLVLFQLTCAYLLRDMAFTWQFWVSAYVFGATTTQALFLGIHEVSHFLAFKTIWLNKALNVVANLPIGIPYSTAFKGYHMEHHMYMGDVAKDTDLPTALEAKFLSNPAGKLFFCIFQIMFYAIRPMCVKQQSFSTWHAINWAVQLSFDAAVIYFFGLGPIYYFLASDFLAGSLHPCAAHFIAEHYVFVGDQETYSYYGWLNNLCFNVGYHNEHHDFPNIAWTRLPELRKIAPEVYEKLPQHKSWVMVLWKFIIDPSVGLHNRVKRGAATVASKDD